MSHRIIQYSLATTCLTAMTACTPVSTVASYTGGDKPSYTIEHVTNIDSPSCVDKTGKAIDSCHPLAKIILTNGNNNLSYQIIKDGNPPKIITCSSPADVAKALTNNQSLTASIPTAKGTVSLTGSDVSSQAVTVVQSVDAATHYVAAASYYNCLAYANGEYEVHPEAAATDLGKIFDNAVNIATGTQPSPAGANLAVPAVPTIASVGPDGGKTKGVLIIKIKAPAGSTSPAITGYKITIASPASGAGTDNNDGAADTTHVFSGLTSATSYSFQVTAINTNGTSKASAASTDQMAP